MTDQPAGRCDPCRDQRATPEQIREARALAARLVQETT